MKRFIVEHLNCITDNCNSSLELECMRTANDDCIEGFLHCNRCDANYPVINGVAVIVNNFSNYISQRTKVLGKWLIECKTESMKKFLKQKSKGITKLPQNRYEKGGAWFRPYMYMRSKEVDKHLKRIVDETFDNLYAYVVDLIKTKLPKNEICLDIGCATGTVTRRISNRYKFIFGVDQSFSFIKEARKQSKSNTEFIVADSNIPFKKDNLDLVIMLNVLDLVNPEELLLNAKTLLRKNGNLVITDPYDFRNERGDPRDGYDGKRIRRFLLKNGFAVHKNTRKESFIPWILRVNECAYIFYFTDLIVAKRSV